MSEVPDDQVVEAGDLEHPSLGAAAGPAASSAAEQRATRGRLPLWRRSRTKHRPSFIAGLPIVGFTGANGAGKTLVAVSCVVNDDLRVGRPVFSTVPIDSVFGRSEPIVSLRQMLELRDCTVLLDEVAVIFSSRDSMLVPREFDVFLQTLRHKGVTVRWTAPAWARADVRLREATHAVVGCHGLGKIRRRGQFWPRPMMVAAGALDTLGIGVDDKPEHVLRRRAFIPQALVGWGAYDSLADTPRIGHPPTGGACVDCGGVVPRVACSTDRHAELGMPGGAPVRARGAR